MDKPKSIVIATRYFLVILLVMLGALCINGYQLLKGTLSIGVVSGASYSPMNTVSILTIWIATFLLFCFLFYKITRRKNWARILFGVLLFISLISYFFQFEAMLALGIIVFVLGIINTILSLIALSYLFRHDARLWFKKEVRQS